MERIIAMLLVSLSLHSCASGDPQERLEREAEFRDYAVMFDRACRKSGGVMRIERFTMSHRCLIKECPPRLGDQLQCDRR